VWLPILRAWDWPKKMGVRKVVFEGRKGFERVVAGVRHLHAVYEVEL
jgi:hypothetical protein